MAYEKQTFKDNETILKAEHLNHIEDGIKANEELINQRYTKTEVDNAIANAIGNAIGNALERDY